MAAAPSARHSVPVRLVALVLVLALAACAPRSRLHAGFDFAAFKRSPTVLGGVANRVKASDVGFVSREEIDDLMEARFMKLRRDLSFVRAGVLRERIGEARYLELIDRYLSGAGIDTSTYVMLREAMGADARYLALARIDSVTVTHGETTRDPDYNVKTDNDEIIKSTHRNVWITLNLFDLEARGEMWSAIQAGSASNDVAFSADRTGGSRGVIAALKVAFRSDPDYPPPPGAHKAIGEALSYLAMRIPKR